MGPNHPIICQSIPLCPNLILDENMSPHHKTCGSRSTLIITSQQWLPSQSWKCWYNQLYKKLKVYFNNETVKEIEVQDISEPLKESDIQLIALSLQSYHFPTTRTSWQVQQLPKHISHIFTGVWRVWSTIHRYSLRTIHIQ